MDEKCDSTWVGWTRPGRSRDEFGELNENTAQAQKRRRIKCKYKKKKRERERDECVNAIVLRKCMRAVYNQTMQSSRDESR